MFHFLNGKIVSDQDARISIMDLAVLRGYAVFDFFRTYGGKPFMLDRHLENLEKSANLLKLKVKYSRDEIKDIIDELLKRNNIENPSFRILVTGGDGTLQGFAVLTEVHEIYPVEYYQNGVKLITHNHLREIPQAKSTAYATKQMLMSRIATEQAFEPLYTFAGNALEAASSNIFMVNGKTLVTPKENVYKGVTRSVVLEILEPKYTVEERDIPLDELLGATEVFITATLKEVMPIIKIDDIIIGNGKVGENTKKIMELFKENINTFLTKHI